MEAGAVLQGRPLPKDDEVPDQLLEASRTWGYIK